ncbi:MAG TPA: hypothetical protein VN962_15705, partial [Polyangia bacterium]|nr:hypothetical protein [Polyangia bacterium]
DQFALGALAYEMLCGRMAFPGEETLAVFNRVVHDHPPPVRSFAPALPAAVNNVLGRALAKEREARFPTVGDFAAAFAQALDVASGAASAIPAAHGAGHPLRTALMEVVAPSTTLRSSAGDMDAVPDPELASLRASPKRRAFLLSVAALGATAVFAIAHRPRRLAGTAALDSNPFRSAGSPASKDPAPVPPAPTRRSPPHLTARDAAAEAPRSLRAAAVPAPVELPSPAPSTAPRTAHPVNAAVSRGPRSKSRAASARAPSAPRASDPQAGSPAPQLHNEDL